MLQTRGTEEGDERCVNDLPWAWLVGRSCGSRGMGECKSNCPFLPSFPSFIPPIRSTSPPSVPLTGGDRTHSFHGQARVWGIARPCCLRSRKALAVEGCQREMARHVVIRMQGPNRTTRRPKPSLDVNNNSLLFLPDFSDIRIIPNFLEITLITSTTRPQTVRLPRWAISTCRPVCGSLKWRRAVFNYENLGPLAAGTDT